MGLQGDGEVAINDLMGAVQAALHGCDVPFRVLREATQFEVESFADQGVVLVNDRAGFDALWEALPEVGYSPTLSFEQCTVAFVFDGFKPIGGNRVQVDSVRESGDGLAFNAISQSPGGGCSGPSGVNQPVQVLVLPKFPDETIARLRSTSRPGPCCRTCCEK